MAVFKRALNTEELRTLAAMAKGAQFGRQPTPHAEGVAETRD